VAPDWLSDRLPNVQPYAPPGLVVAAGAEPSAASAMSRRSASTRSYWSCAINPPKDVRLSNVQSGCVSVAGARPPGLVLAGLDPERLKRPEGVGDESRLHERWRMDELFVTSFLVTAGLLVAALALRSPQRLMPRNAAASTRVNPDKREPIDARMPRIPPA
jgi:hypothetical protein